MSKSSHSNSRKLLTIIGEKKRTAIPPSIRNEPSEIGGPGTQNNRSLINLKPSV